MIGTITVVNVRTYMPDPAGEAFCFKYCGRASPQYRGPILFKGPILSKGSILCNPYKISKNTSREKSIELYKGHFRELMNKHLGAFDLVCAMLGFVKGGGHLHLGCWCAPEACHCDVIKAFIMTREGVGNDARTE